MNLEVNLVKVKTVDSKLGRLLDRRRYLINDDTQIMDSIQRFIADCSTTFTTVITDNRLVAQLSNLAKLTVTDLDCLRYVLSMHGLDIWYQFVSDVEQNPQEIPQGMFEYNIIDLNNVRTFVPFCTKFMQTSGDNKLTELYQKIIEGYALFNSSIFAGINNPLTNMVQSMKSDEEALGVVPTTKTTYVNSVFEFLKKDIRVLTN